MKVAASRPSFRSQSAKAVSMSGWSSVTTWRYSAFGINRCAAWPASRGCTGSEPGQQLVQILGPFLVLRGADDRHRRGAAIAPVVEDDAVARFGDLLRQRPQCRAGPPPARLQADERALVAEDLVIYRNAANIGAG